MFKGENIKLKVREEEWDFYFYQKKMYRLKVEIKKKNFEAGSLTIPHYRWANRGWEELGNLPKVAQFKTRPVWLQSCP